MKVPLRYIGDFLCPCKVQTAEHKSQNILRCKNTGSKSEVMVEDRMEIKTSDSIIHNFMVFAQTLKTGWGIRFLIASECPLRHLCLHHLSSWIPCHKALVLASQHTATPNNFHHQKQLAPTMLSSFSTNKQGEKTTSR